MLRRNLGMVAIYGLVAIAGCQVFYFNAVQHLSVGVALLLEYMGIILVVGWLWLRSGQRPRRLTIAGSVAAVVGLVLVLDLAGDTQIDLVGVLWGLGAAVGLAVLLRAVGQERQRAAAAGDGQRRHGHRRGDAARAGRGRRAADAGQHRRRRVRRPPGQLAGAGYRPVGGRRRDRLRGRDLRGPHTRARSWRRSSG